MSDSESFPLVSKRSERIRRRQTAQHTFVAFFLLATGFNHWLDGKHLVLPLLEIISGAAMIVAFVIERKRQHALGGVAWVELAGAVMLFVEAIAKLEEPHHVSFYVVSFIPPLIFLAFALFDAQIAAMRAMTADDERFTMRLRLWLRKSVAWRDVVSWTRSADAMDVKLKSGRSTRFRFRDVANRDEAMDWAAAQFARRVSAAENLPGGERRSEERDRDQILVPEQR